MPAPSANSSGPAAPAQPYGVDRGYDGSAPRPRTLSPTRHTGNHNIMSRSGKEELQLSSAAKPRPNITTRGKKPRRAASARKARHTTPLSRRERTPHGRPTATPAAFTAGGGTTQQPPQSLWSPRPHYGALLQQRVRLRLGGRELGSPSAPEISPPPGPANSKSRSRSPSADAELRRRLHAAERRAAEAERALLRRAEE
eukprot:gene5003-4822_t